MKLEDLYNLSREYRQQAYRHSQDIHTESQLKQYYTLINLSIQTARHIKSTFKLTIDQDYEITMDLVDTLLHDTLNFELAEMYLSALRQRLQNYSGGGAFATTGGILSAEYLNKWLQIEFTALYTVSLNRKSTFHCRVALQNCEDLLSYLRELRVQDQQSNTSGNVGNNLENSTVDTATPFELLDSWYQIFKYVAAQLCIWLGRVKRARMFLEELLTEKDSTINATNNPQWTIFIKLTLVTLSLENRSIDIPSATIEEYLRPIEEDNASNENLYIWQLVTRLLYKIRNDKNITDELNEFKRFFDSHRQQEQEQQEENVPNSNFIQISFTETLRLQFYHPTLFNHRDLKYLLLFLQSISYMVNCYDESANFSTRFLPKVIRTMETNLEWRDSNVTSISNDDFKITQGIGNATLSDLDSKLVLCDTVLQYAKFYQVWEYLLSRSSLKETKSFDILKLPYSDILQVMLLQQLGDNVQSFDTPNYLESYEMLCNSTKQTSYHHQYESLSHHSNCLSTEFELLALINQYSILSALISEQSGKRRQESLDRVKLVWSKVETMTIKYNFIENLTWDCTLMVLWLVSHMDLFTSSPLPSSEGERSVYMDKLRLYYTDNSFIASPKSVNDDPEATHEPSFKLKRSLFLMLMVNYLGGRLIETDLDKMFELSSKCFQVAKKQGMVTIAYVIGLWHLTNCTVMMKARDVAVTNAKLQSLVKRMCGDV